MGRAVPRAAWDGPSPFAAGQTAGEALASFSFRLLGLSGEICVVGRSGARPVFGRVADWLPGLPVPEPGGAAAGLVRKYLRCYGPSTVEDFGSWAGAHPAHAARLWDSVARDLVPVDVGAARAWIHRDDAQALLDAGAPSGVRLLPALDPWVQARDTHLLLPDQAKRGRVWRAQGWPGTVISRGRIVALWRAKGHGHGVRFGVDPLDVLDPSARALIEEEAHRLAAFRGHPRAEVAYTTGG